MSGVGGRASRSPPEELRKASEIRGDEKL